MFIACKCLNVLIGEENIDMNDVETGKLGLSLEEQRDPFFQEKLGSLCSSNATYADPSLLEVRSVGAWLIYQCLVCQTLTHAVLSTQPHQMLINLKLTTTKEEIERLRQSDNYSPVFKILVNRSLGEDSNKPFVSSSHPAAGNLNRKLGKALQAEVDAVQEAVRLFTERKYAEFEEFRERAHRDHKIISCIFSGADNNVGNVSLANNINRNTIPLASDNNMISSQLRNKVGQTTNNMSNYINTTVANKPLRNNNTTTKNPVNLDCYKEDSLDSEGIFDLEGTDLPHNGLNSDVYDSDSDDSVSRDEGIHISRNTAQPWNSSIAKSLPVNVPAFTQFHEMSQERLDQHGDETQDIAASIKALARSVHGDVFGDLPRPRFSTQI